jgi:hypothetical protein
LRRGEVNEKEYETNQGNIWLVEGGDGIFRNSTFELNSISPSSSKTIELLQSAQLSEVEVKSRVI